MSLSRRLRQRGKKIPVLFKEQSDIAKVLASHSSILLYQILNLKSKTGQKPPGILLHHHHHHLRSPTVSIHRVLVTKTKTLKPGHSPPTTELWRRRPRHSHQTIHHPPQVLATETKTLKPGHSPPTTESWPRGPRHSPPAFPVPGTESETPKQRHPSSPGPSSPRATTASSSKQQALPTTGDFIPPRCCVSEVEVDPGRVKRE
jgi:hypothetical protein